MIVTRTNKNLRLKWAALNRLKDGQDYLKLLFYCLGLEFLLLLFVCAVISGFIESMTIRGLLTFILLIPLGILGLMSLSQCPLCSQSQYRFIKLAALLVAITFVLTVICDFAFGLPPSKEDPVGYFVVFSLIGVHLVMLFIFLWENRCIRIALRERDYVKLTALLK